MDLTTLVVFPFVQVTVKVGLAELLVVLLAVAFGDAFFTGDLVGAVVLVVTGALVFLTGALTCIRTVFVTFP